MSRVWGWLSLPLALVALALAAWLFWPAPRGPATPADAAALFAVLAKVTADAGPTAGDSAAAPVFPLDHGAHGGQPLELWDLSAHLDDADGGAYAVRITLVRAALGATARASAFAAGEVIAARLVVIPPEATAPLVGVRASRAALGLAGVTSATDAAGALLWVEDWRLERGTSGTLRLYASLPEVDIALVMEPVKPPVGQNELIATRGGRAGDAAPGAGLSGYLEPRLRVSGQLTRNGVGHAVSGTALLEHVWGAGLAGGVGGRGQLTVNRFMLQLADGDDLVCLELRRRGGGGTPVPRCVLIAADDTRRAFERREVSLSPVGRPWSSETGEATWPLRWRLAVPALALTVDIAPVALAQESPLFGGLWSGAVTVTGTRDGAPVRGSGRMDLGGYGAGTGSLTDASDAVRN